jgi:hypothetical protein
MSDNTAMKSKIEKLLAKAERAATPEEAEAYTNKAERLMVQWGIDEAELEAGGTVKPEEIIEVKLTFKASYGPTMVTFAHAVCLGFGNLRCLQSSLGDSDWRYFWIIGHRSDVESVQILLASLQIQAMTELKKWQRTAPERRWMTDWEKWKSNRQFLVSFAWAVNKRLKATRIEMEADVTMSTALVLAGKSTRVDAYMDEAHPNLRKGRGGMSGSRYGGEAGRAAGERASLGGAAVGAGRASISS